MYTSKTSSDIALQSQFHSVSNTQQNVELLFADTNRIVRS